MILTRLIVTLFTLGGYFCAVITNYNNLLDTGAFIPNNIMAEAAKPDVISADQSFELGSDPEGTPGSFKEKRCKTDGYTYDLVGSSLSSLPTLHLTRRDLQSDTLKKRCDMCKEGPRCKKLGKCDLCAQICERYEAFLKSQVLDLQERDVHEAEPTKEHPIEISSRFGQENFNHGLSEQEDRYYTVGTFAPGPNFDLITRLLGIENTDSIERFVVLAKAKSKTKGSPATPNHPVVIDTAHIFTINEGKPKELDFEIHEVDDAKESFSSLASAVNKELDEAMDAKKKIEGNAYLTPNEIDQVIEKAVAQVDKNSADVVGISSRISNDNDGDTTITPTTTQEIPLEVQNNGEKDDNSQSGESNESTEKIGKIREQLPNEEQRSNQTPEIENRQLLTPEGQFQSLDALNAEGYQTQQLHNFDSPIPNQVYNYNQQQETGQIFEAYNQKPLPYSDNQFTDPMTTYHSTNQPEEYNHLQPPQESEDLPPKIYVPDGVVADEDVVGNGQQSFPEILDKQYKDLKQWASENVGSSQQPRIPDELVHRVNDIIDGATSSAIRLNEKISKLVESNMDNNPPSLDQIVRLNNMKEFATRFSPEEQNEIMDKAPAEAMVSSKNPYETHPRMGSSYENGKFISQKLAPKRPPYQSQYPGMERMNEVVAQQPDEPFHNNQPPFIDPKLLNMKSIVQDLKRMPDYVFQKAGEVADALEFKTKAPSSTTVIPSAAMLLARSGTNDADNKIENSTAERVACSDEESDEYYREAAKSNEDISTELIKTDAKPAAETREVEEQNYSNSKEETQTVTNQEAKSDNETVACSKEEESNEGYELIHVNPAKYHGGYRASIKEELEKLHHLPATLEEIIHPKAKSSNKANGNLPKHSSHPQVEDAEQSRNKQHEEESTSDYIADLNKMHKHGHSSKYQQIPEADEDDVPQPMNFDRANGNLPKHFSHPQVDDVEQSRNKQHEEESTSDIADLSKMQKHGHSPKYQQTPEADEDAFPQSMNFDRFVEPQAPMDASGFPPRPEDWQIQAQPENEEIIGSPILESRFQSSAENYTNLGRLIPDEFQPLSLHSRDVSDQMIPREMYFIGDGIKLPLNMKETDDGSLHLSVDVKRLCKCRNCNRTRNRTLLHRETLGAIENDDGAALLMPTPNLFVEDDRPAVMNTNEPNDGKTEISKRSPRTNNNADRLQRLDDSGELVPVFGKYGGSGEDIEPIKRRNSNSRINLVKRKVGLVTNVLDWMKRVALEEAELHNKLK